MHYAADARSMGMRNGALAFSLGVVAAHGSPWAHSLWACWLCLGIALLVPRRARTLAAAILGLGWGALHAVDAVGIRIDRSCTETAITGRIVDLPAWSEPVAPGTPRARRFVVLPQTAGLCHRRPCPADVVRRTRGEGRGALALRGPAPGTAGDRQHPWIRHRPVVCAQSGGGHGLRPRGNPDGDRRGVRSPPADRRSGTPARPNRSTGPGQPRRRCGADNRRRGGDSEGRRRPLPAHRDHAPARHFGHACRRRHRVRVLSRPGHGPAVGCLAPVRRCGDGARLSGRIRLSCGSGSAVVAGVHHGGGVHGRPSRRPPCRTVGGVCLCAGRRPCHGPPGAPVGGFLAVLRCRCCVARVLCAPAASALMARLCGDGPSCPSQSCSYRRRSASRDSSIP